MKINVNTEIEVDGVYCDKWCSFIEHNSGTCGHLDGANCLLFDDDLEKIPHSKKLLRCKKCLITKELQEKK